MTNDLVVGAWKAGLSEQDLAYVNLAQTQEAEGHRLLPLSSTVVALANLLDGYDDFAEELLLAECDYVDEYRKELLLSRGE